jgi:NAD+ synthase (glutamine-hydrolysing)
LFKSSDDRVLFGVEVCQDLWVQTSPSDHMSMAGANLIFNLSASTEYISKRESRLSVVQDHSRKQHAAYVYTSSGAFESTSENLFSSHKIIASLGEIIGEYFGFELTATRLVCDLDMDHINYQKRQDASYRSVHSNMINAYEIVEFNLIDTDQFTFEKSFNETPFIPKNKLEETCAMIHQIQVTALAQRIASMPKQAKNIVWYFRWVWIQHLPYWSVLMRWKRLGLSSRVIAVTMPAKATQSESLKRAIDLMSVLEVTSLEIPIAKLS